MNSYAVLPIGLAVLLCSNVRADSPPETEKGTLNATVSKVAVSIEAQPLPAALNKWAEQTGMMVMVPSEKDTEAFIAPAVVGEYSAEEALEKLLGNTGFTYQFVNPRTVAIHALKETASPKLENTTGAAAPGEPSSIRLAQATVGEGSPSAGQGQVPKEQEGKDGGLEELEEIVVTGTHIRGSQPAGSKVIVLDRAYIEKSGYGRVEDVLATLPQTFGGNTEGNQSQAGQNFNRGSEVQLRGLGPGTTLVLVNGHRQAAGGLQGGFVDISSIPTAAVERIDVLPDGASAIYGSDAIGGVVNIVLRKDFTGAETMIRAGTAEGGAQERQISQLLGTAWSSGSALFGYQYSRRDELAATERDASRSSGDFTARGGSDFRSVAGVLGGVPGTIINPFTGEPAFAIPAGQDGTQLTVDELTPGANFADFAQTLWVLPRQELNAAFFTGTQRLSESVELLADVRYGRREFRQPTGSTSVFLFVPDSNPFYVNPFEADLPGLVVVKYDPSKDLGIPEARGTVDTYAATLGGRIELNRNWELSVSGSYANEKNRLNVLNQFSELRMDEVLASDDSAPFFNPFGDGGDNDPATLAFIRRPEVSRGESTVKTVDAIANGSAFTLPGGSARFALGASYRDDSLTALADTGVSDDLSRHATAAFAEVALPLVSPDESRRGLTRLELSLAGRYEEYSDFGSTFDPKYGIAWWPLDSIKVRGTWSTAFRAPSFSKLSQVLTNTASVLLTDVPDPESQTGSSNVLILVGGNPDLQEETATVWTAGVDVTLPTLANLTFSATYFNIDYRDKVSSPPSLGSVFANQDQFAALLTRDPSQTQIDEVCSRADFISDPDACAVLPIQLILDGREKNVSLNVQRGIDLTADYAFDLLQSNWRLTLNSTYIISNDTAITETSPETDIVDTVAAPLALRLRGGLSWRRGGWDADAILNYQGSYPDTVNDAVSATPRTVESWMTTHLHLGYGFGERSDWLSGTRLALNVVNAFDEQPPFVNHFNGYDYANGSLLGRFLSVQITKSWAKR